MNPLITRWGAEMGRIPHTEYPRPQMRRKDWTCLNGVWLYAIRDASQNDEPVSYDGDIVVPFSPESLLSGVGRQLLPGQTLWYRRVICFEAVPQGQRLLLHFGAVDQRCRVYVNGHIAARHEGGYWPFCMDITKLIHKNGGNHVLTVAVTDDSDMGTEAYGKQKLKRGGIWYTAQSGIWQTVWAELVPERYIEGLEITPLYSRSEVEFTLHLSQTLSDKTDTSKDEAAGINVQILAGEKIVAEGQFHCNTFRLPIPEFKPWSPDDPFLYTVKIVTGEDEVDSYFGMREFSITQGRDGKPRLGLNGKPIFHSGLLDQGYWSDGLYTAPSDEAIIWELTEVKRLGFNMLRKHIKIEPLRWYYHCDRLGILVWQDFVSGGRPYGEFVTRYLPFVGLQLSDRKNRRGFGRRNKDGRMVFERDMKRTVRLLKSIVSIAVWVPFNEGWGQYDAQRITDELRALDSTRLVDHASGWHDQKCGDFSSHHVYYKPFHMKPDTTGRIVALTEFGGYSCPSEGHMTSDKLFGYRMYKNMQSLTKAYELLYQNEIIPSVEQGLSAAIYTQLSDVEDEINGLFTYDRATLKLEANVVADINKKLLTNI